MDYKIGDSVRATKQLTESASEESPAQHFCDRGDVLIVRSVGGLTFPIYVSHKYITDRSFGVHYSEIEKIPTESESAK